MALTDDEQAKLEKELSEARSQLTELLAKAKTEKTDAKEKEKERASEKPDKQQPLSPDVLKEIAEQKLRIEALEKKSGSPVGGLFSNFNLFD